MTAPDPARAEAQFRQVLDTFRIPPAQQMALLNLALAWTEETRREAEQHRAQEARHARPT